ncbi:hypothetical protein GJU43_13935 [Flavobacterium sp. LC2016-23]|uniref:hypothetical protein n=1 Tax=Flavobacterium sp. LC2016-23 TaxID=2666330 RepID=UPI0012B148D8|nr:hypothetical protein [Flavobacterium sp. LC2016-23]MRX40383.1 hypothetical protein [Flavobacterium sp. LC2016-23]
MKLYVDAKLQSLFAQIAKNNCQNLKPNVKMKVELKFTNYQLSFLNAFIADNLPASVHGEMKDRKSFIFLMNDVSCKLLKKAIEKRQEAKAFKISLKYYEAFALHQFLYLYMDYDNTERYNVTREILGVINQKLA